MLLKRGSLHQFGSQYLVETGCILSENFYKGNINSAGQSDSFTRKIRSAGTDKDFYAICLKICCKREQRWTTSFGRTSAQCYAFISSYFQENLSALRTRVRSLQHKNRLLLWQMLKTGLQRAQANWTPERNQPRSKGERTSHPPWQELAINLYSKWSDNFIDENEDVWAPWFEIYAEVWSY